MKRKNTLWSLVLALVMVLGVIAPVATLAAQPEETKNITVNVHKILMSKDDLKAHDEKKTYKPSEGVASITDFFGASAQAIDGVYFVAIKEGDALYGNETIDASAFTEEEWKAKEDAKTAGLTAGGGVIQLNLDNPGNYKIFEVKSKSKYVGADKKLLAETKAVPVILELPKHATTSTGVAKEIHVYPKNTEDGPTVTKKVKQIKKETVVTENGVKTVKNEYVDADQATFDIGQEHTWAIEATIPTGFKDYKIFKLTDTLKKALTYKAGQEVSVKVGDVALEDGDYKVTEPTPTSENGGTLTVELTEAGIAKLAKSYEGQTLRVEFVTTINKNAVMSQDITNKVKLEYGHDNSNKQDKESNEPKVYTGGKKFKKIDPDEGNKKLPGAKFVVMRTVGEGNDVVDQYLFETEPNKYSWKTVKSDKAEDLKKEENIKVLTSDSEGLFEITGLKYDRPNGTKYKIVEIEAPEGYALPSNNKTEFTVNDTSYYKDATQVKLEAADPDNINNKKVDIPQTGGMGTMIFMVAGLALMGGAFIAMRKRSAEQA